MAQKCTHCGSTTTTTATDHYVCLVCGASSRYSAPEDRGRVETTEPPAVYAGDDGITYG